MPAQVVSFLRRARPVSRDWSQDELAEFYRVESSLLQAGMRIETDRGVTDEGDPWFAFCRADDGETFIHFARIDGRYIIAGPAYEGVAQGYDFPELVRDLISRHPLVQPQLQRRNNTNIFMHPAALLIAVVGTAFFKTADAKAAELGDDHHKGEKRHIAGASAATVPAPSIPAMLGSAPMAGGQIILDAAQTLTLVASAMAAMTPAATVAHSATLFAPPVAQSWEWSPTLAGQQAIVSGQPEHTVLPAPSALASKGVAETAQLHQYFTAPSAAAMSALLSLAAVLQDLPKPAALNADAFNLALALLPDSVRNSAGVENGLPAPTPVAAAVPASVAAPAPAPAPAASEVKAAAPAVLIVELNSAALPDVAAIRLVRDLGTGITHDSVIKADQLPDVLAQLIAKGEHLQPTDILAQLNAKGDQMQSSLTTPATDTHDSHDNAGGAGGTGGSGSGSGSSSHDTTTAPPATTHDTTPVVQTPTVPADAGHDAAPPADKPVGETPVTETPFVDTPIATTPPPAETLPETIPTPPPAADSGGDTAPVHNGQLVTNATMDGIIAYFAAYAPIEVMVSGHGIVIYDARILTSSDALEKAESVTYTFEDGSTISLVGSGLTLHAAGALH